MPKVINDTDSVDDMLTMTVKGIMKILLAKTLLCIVGYNLHKTFTVIMKRTILNDQVTFWKICWKLIKSIFEFRIQTVVE